MYCGHCGQQIPVNSRFCEQCGKPVVQSVVPNPVGPAPVTPPARGFFGLTRAPAQRSKSPDYSRIVLWIQGRYGSRFIPGMDAGQVRVQLEAILASEQARGIPAKALKGFRSFITSQHSLELLQVRR